MDTPGFTTHVILPVFRRRVGDNWFNLCVIIDYRHAMVLNRFHDMI